MDRNTTRRGVLAALLGGGTGALALSPASGFLDRFAPLSGAAWQSARNAAPGTVESPYGTAEVTYDDYHVPHVSADDEAAAYFATGYVQAADRLFQMDLVRRRMRGTLSAALGEQTVEQDVFARKMDFLGCAEASADVLTGTESERLTEAFAEGVNRYIDVGPLPMEFGLVGYEPEPWEVVDSLLVGVQIAWGLTGSFGTLRRAVLRDAFDGETYDRLYGSRFDHGTPIIRDEQTGDVTGVAEAPGAGVADPVDQALVDWLGQFEPPDLWGSNNWVVSGDHTESGDPVVCNDPHLTLMAPPVWYEQRIETGDVDVRGVTFPGVPFVVIGETDFAAWGFTNVGADVVDFYDYETDDAMERYRYGGEWRDFETESQTVAVAGGDDRTVEVRKTVHGAFLDREVDGERRQVGVAWTGMSGTRESQAIYELSHVGSVEEFESAIRKFDLPTQNVVYADADGETRYHVTGKIPIRRVDGEVVRGNAVFDGSAGVGEWEGFKPYDRSSWDGFVSFEEKPGVVNPDYLGTANQRVVDDPAYPIGQEYASGFRGIRVYERLDAAVEDGGVTRSTMQSVQRDVVDVRARKLVPALLEARDRMPEAAGEYLDALAEWDYRMDRDSTAALFFRWFLESFRERTWTDDFEAHGLDDAYWPQEWVLVTLPPDSEFFGGDRAAVLAEAAGAAADRLDAEGWETYGDYNTTAVDHPFGGNVSGLNYTRYPTDGSAYTVFNFRKDSEAGSSWRMVSPVGGESRGVVPGGNHGSYFSDHYDDQLEMWADGEYKPLPGETSGDLDVAFEGGDR
jgi:penicillin amidase